MTMTDLELIADAARQGYTDAQVKGDAGVVAICRFMYTWALLSDLSNFGYDGRWCYSSYDKARSALDAWDGADGTEPDGWHRHPDSGRRRDASGVETVML